MIILEVQSVVSVQDAVLTNKLSREMKPTEQDNQAAIAKDTEIEQRKFNTSMKEKIIYMDYEDGLFDEINASLDGSTARDNNRLTFYQGQQMDTLKFINQIP